MEIQSIEKRDGRIVSFEKHKITDAIMSAVKQVGGNDREEAERLTDIVVDKLCSLGIETPNVEQIQDIVEKVLIEEGHANTAKEYILFRANRDRVRNMNNSLMRTFEELTFGSSNDVELKRENANIDGDTAMGTMLRYGSEGAKAFNLGYLVAPHHSRAHKNGDIHMHDLDFMALTETCCQIDIEKLFNGGFNTGHGTLREPGEIRSYAALACIAIQANQNEMHGGQSIPAFDHYMAPGVAKTFIKELYKVLGIKYPEANKGAKESINGKLTNEGVKQTLKAFRKENRLILDRMDKVREVLKTMYMIELTGDEIEASIKSALSLTEDDTHQAMEALVHNLNSMHSRAGRIWVPELWETVGTAS